MHDDCAFLHAAVPREVHAILPVMVLVGKLRCDIMPLVLYPEQHDGVRSSDRLIKFRVWCPRVMVDPLGRCCEPDIRPEPLERLLVAVGNPAVDDVPRDDDIETAESAEPFIYRHQVEQRIWRMGPATVNGIYHWDVENVTLSVIICIRVADDKSLRYE